ncbi:MAG: PASTA domain-containing protein [Candidatus Eisenbacteria bacterium]|nr:PASTA domain-containing protein [Candidatus Eisenbacteria bacterium]
MRVFRFLLIAVALGALSFVGGIFLMDVVMGGVVGRGDVVSVPSIEELPEEEASLRLEETGLYLAVDRIEFSALLDSGIVLRQRPAAGERVKRGRRIGVILSAGAERAAVPELVGERIRQARIALAEKGLRVGGVISVPHETVEEQRVIATDPVAGTATLKGAPVDLLVSLGPEPSRFLAPDLVGLPLAEVRRHLRLFGLSLANVAYETETDKPEGTVLAQTPPPGVRLDRDRRIELKVASP